MRTYITNINGHAPSSTAMIAQNMVTDIACQLGYRELAIYAYNMNHDSDSELSKRIDGILAGVRHGDTVIFQTPTWNTTAFDRRLMEKLKLYDIRIILFIHDVVPLMFSGNFYLMETTIDYYNKADVIIAPSQAMIDHLREHGLTVKKTVIQGMWDHPTQAPLLPAQFEKVIHFPGNPDRFSFVTKWESPLELRLYTGQSCDNLPEHVTKMVYRPDEQLIMEMSAGGFGLVWMDDHDKEYQKRYCPYKLGAFIAAGIPVFVQRGIANEALITENQLGFVIDSLDQALEIITHMTDTEYQSYVHSVRRFAPLVRQGFFTRKLLTEAVFKALCH
ncbi:sugar transferase [Streptococcus plurextorum]|uniref:sugar transferase n=1 Tax=Streptococcus plurextorum TaxID=456876 RepID=UPI00041B49B4|nr:sugar transferase [Streptococcus plurextorum]